MREGIVLYDQGLREIWACPNVDARARQEANRLVAEGLAEQIYETGGDWVGIISPPRLHWIARHQPDVLERTRHLSMISDWVLVRLSGQIATDPSVGSSSGLFDLRNRSWSRELIARLQLPEEIFPRVLAPGTVLGKVTATAASQTGLVEGTAVVVGGADTQLALLGSGGVEPGRLTVVAGTFWQTALLSATPLIDPVRRLRTLCHVVPSQWMTEGIGFLNGLAMRWLRDTVCEDMSRAARASSPEKGTVPLGRGTVPFSGGGRDPYDDMERLAEQAPVGSDGVFALVSDVMNARRWIQAPTCFVGLDLGKVEHAGPRGKGLMIRAVQESAAFTAWAHYQILQELWGHSASMMVFCGGASRGRLWPQIMADVFDLPVQVPEVKEATSLGAALCALVGLGEYASLAEAAAALVRWHRTVEPNPGHVAVYQPIVRMALDLQRGLMEWVLSGRLREMWQAAGADAEAPYHP
ncbi:MAG: autoinducer-2 kinase [Planctomycetes bacterium]|nr:autoinducer-2 kinase [Planctomycetota bacterium]